jgi:riboflavin kinase/FMN adenylyltransferase
MRVVHGLQELHEILPASAVTIGNFDGVHLAHQKLLESVVKAARRLSAMPTAVTFDPHPTRVLAPERAPKLLTPLEVKARLIEQRGIEMLAVLPFTPELSRLSPLDFVHQILRAKLRAVSLHVGPNFRFGHRHAGDVRLLAELAPREGFKLEVLPEVEIRGQRVSSTRIRELLFAGKVVLAGRLLGRPYSMRGPIVHGLGVGKKLTVPTLNLAPLDVLHPKDGVYVTHTRLGNTVYESVTNVGHKPTFGEHRLTVECYLLNLRSQMHQAEMQVDFLHRLRDEIKFPDPAALKAQIQEDVRRSLRFFRLLKLLRPRATQASLHADR